MQWTQVRKVVANLVHLSGGSDAISITLSRTTTDSVACRPWPRRGPVVGLHGTRVRRHRHRNGRRGDRDQQLRGGALKVREAVEAARRATRRLQAQARATSQPLLLSTTNSGTHSTRSRSPPGQRSPTSYSATFAPRPKARPRRFASSSQRSIAQTKETSMGAITDAATAKPESGFDPETGELRSVTWSTGRESTSPARRRRPSPNWTPPGERELQATAIRIEAKTTPTEREILEADAARDAMLDTIFHKLTTPVLRPRRSASSPLIGDLDGAYRLRRGRTA